MYIDALTEVSSSQAIANATPVVSEDSIDLTAAARVGNECIHFNVNVEAVGVLTGLTIEVIGADAANLTGNVVSYSSVTVLPVVDANYSVKPIGLAKRRYLGLRYTTAGATPTATVTAAVTVNRQATWQD
jgi:hypothetical protein